jgi:hypothetical protein
MTIVYMLQMRGSTNKVSTDEQLHAARDPIFCLNKQFFDL